MKGAREGNAQKLSIIFRREWLFAYLSRRRWMSNLSKTTANSTAARRSQMNTPQRRRSEWNLCLSIKLYVPLISSPAVERAHDELFYCSRWWWFVCFSEKLLHKNENKKVLFFLESIKSARFMCRCAFGMAYFRPFAACCCGKHNSERLNSHYVITSLQITEN